MMRQAPHLYVEVFPVGGSGVRIVLNISPLSHDRGP